MDLLTGYPFFPQSESEAQDSATPLFIPSAYYMFSTAMFVLSASVSQGNDIASIPWTCCRDNVISIDLPSGDDYYQ